MDSRPLSSGILNVHEDDVVGIRGQGFEVQLAIADDGDRVAATLLSQDEPGQSQELGLELFRETKSDGERGYRLQALVPEPPWRKQVSRRSATSADTWGAVAPCRLRLVCSSPILRAPGGEPR